MSIAPVAGSTVLFEGDSLTGFRVPPCLDTWAWQRLSNAHIGYPERVGDWLFCNRPDLRLTVRNGAVGGSIMADVMTRFAAVTGALKPGLVVMTIGGNDMARGVPLATFREQVGEYCSRLAAAGGRVIYLGNPAACHGAAPDLAERRAKAQPYYRSAAELVTAAGGLAVDLGPILLHRTEALRTQYDGHTIYHDGGHFNAVGNEILAGIVLRAMGLVVTPGDPAWAGV